MAIPDARDELIRLHTFSDADLALIGQRRGLANRLGFAVQLCYLRFPGVVLAADAPPFAPLLRMVAAQVKVPADVWGGHSERAETRREHPLELQAVLGLHSFTTTQHYRPAVHSLGELAWQTDKGIVLAASLVASLRRQSLLLPTANVIERICAEAVTRANRRIHAALTDPLSDEHRVRLDELLKRREGSKATQLAWLRQSAVKPNSRHMREHIECLKAWQTLDLPDGIDRAVNQNRLLKISPARVAR